MLDVEMFLDVVIHTVQHGQLHQLAYLGPETYAAISAKAVYNGAYRLSGPAVFDFLAHHGLRDLVRRAVKEFADVAAQYPAVSSMFTVIPAEMDLHAVKAEIRAFAFKAGTVIVDKAFCDLFVKRIIAQASLKLPVSEPCGHDPAFLWFMDIEDLIRTDLVFAFKKILPQEISVLKAV